MTDVASAIAIIVALFFAMNIGASGSAAAMGEPYGAGALRRPLSALLLVAVFVFLGAVIGGGPVAQTIGSGIINTSQVGPALVLVILSSACLTLFTANLLAIPLSTSEVTVGAVVGVGLALGGVVAKTLVLIVATWIALPIISFVFAIVARRYIIPYFEVRLATLKRRTLVRRVISLLLIGSGCYQAFAAGMNNVANAIGPLLSANLLDFSLAMLIGSAGVAVGALLLGRRVLETNAKKITRLSLLDGTMVSLTGGTLVVLASLAGVPVPLTQITTAGIIGIGHAKRDGTGLNRSQVIKILRVWAMSPFASLLLALGLANVVLNPATGAQIGMSILWIVASGVLLIAQARGLVRAPRRDVTH